MSDQKTQTGHPRSFGGMRLEKGPQTPIGKVCYEMPDGTILQWDERCRSPIVCRETFGDRIVLSTWIGD